jgi:putative DNA primase/helicase
VEKLIKEGPGVLNWMLEGYKRYKARGRLVKSTSIKQETEEYQRDEDWYTSFLDDIIKKAVGTIKARDLHSAYVSWCASQTPPIKARSETAFGRAMSIRFRKKRGNDGRYEYEGIGFKGQVNL